MGDASGAKDDDRQSVPVGGGEQPVDSAAIFERRCLIGLEDDAAQRLQTGRGGSISTTLQARGRRPRPASMCRSGRGSAGLPPRHWDRSARGAIGQRIGGRQNSVRIDSQIIVEQQRLDAQAHPIIAVTCSGAPRTLACTCASTISICPIPELEHAPRVFTQKFRPDMVLERHILQLAEDAVERQAPSGNNRHT